MRAKNIDIYTGMRPDQRPISVLEVEEARTEDQSVLGRVQNVVGALFSML